MIDLSALRRLAEGATPGPWGDDAGNGSIGSIVAADDYHMVAQSQQIVGDNLEQDQRRTNTAYIAALHPGTCIALLDALEAVIEWVKANDYPPDGEHVMIHRIHWRELLTIIDGITTTDKGETDE